MNKTCQYILTQIEKLVQVQRRAVDEVLREQHQSDAGHVLQRSRVQGEAPFYQVVARARITTVETRLSFYPFLSLIHKFIHSFINRFK